VTTSLSRRPVPGLSRIIARMVLSLSLMDLAEVCRIVFSPVPILHQKPGNGNPAGYRNQMIEMQNRSMLNRCVLDWLDITLQS
jgi:hypothetical protein